MRDGNLDRSGDAARVFSVAGWIWNDEGLAVIAADPFVVSATVWYRRTASAAPSIPRRPFSSKTSRSRFRASAASH